MGPGIQKGEHMGILSGSVTTTRYKIDGELSGEAILEGIKKFRFADLDDHETEYSSGWTSAEKNFIPDFDKIFNVSGYLVFSLRIDKKNIPANVVKKNVVLESDRRLKGSGKDFLTKAEKKEIKEQVAAMIAHKMPLSPEIHDVLVDLNEGTVSIFTGSQSVCDEFETLFSKSFRTRLIRLFPFTMAVHRTGAPDDQEMFFGSPKGCDASVAYAKHKQLGSDFLTWLWYMVEKDTTHLYDALDINLFLSDKRKITLENHSTKDAESIVIKNDGDNLKEAFVSLSKGAKVTQIGIKLDLNDHHWFLSLKDKDLSPVSMKMPMTVPAETEDDDQGVMLERIGLYNKAIEAIEELFSYFVGLWSSDDQKTEIQDGMDKWVKRELGI